MSKERELLIRIVNNDKACGVFFLTPKFKEQIKELLAQPEHIEDKLAMVEPVAWIIETQKIDGAFDKWVSMDKKHHRDFCDRGEPIPLYTSPPKREPLDNLEIMTIAAEHTWDLKSFARAIEKAHGIGEIQ